MQINTSRFGTLDVQANETLLFPRGLIGFESCRHWVLLPDTERTEVAWLQSLAMGSVALPVVSPRRYQSDFRIRVSQRQLGPLELHTQDRFYVLVVVSKTGSRFTINLKSPLVFNLSRRLGAQVICEDDQPVSLPIGTWSEPRAIRLAA